MILQQYADDHGFHNCQFYVDDGYSGVDSTRPAYVQMLKDIENEKIGTVIVKDQSRLGRDHLETDRLMELPFPSYDVQGEMDKFAGYLFCAECGARLYLRRGKTINPKANNFQCGGYQTKGNSHCTSHYIRESVLNEIVLTSLRQMTAYARENTEEFYAMATANGEAEAERFYVTAERQKTQITARISQLDNIIRCLYEDRVTDEASEMALLPA